jgi:hypothetical protein
LPYELKEEFSTARELNHGIKVLDLKKIQEVIRGIDTHLTGKTKAFSLRIHIADPDDVHIEGGEGFFLQKLQENPARLASANDR